MKTLAFLYVFLFVCIFQMHAIQPTSKQQQPPKDCVKHPQIVNKQTEKTTPKVVVEKTTPAHTSKGGTSIPHFSVLNFINFFYSKDTLDNLRVM